MSEEKSEAVFSQFEEIEKRVGQLIEKIVSLEKVNKQQESKIAELDSKLEEKEEAEEQYQQEKAQVRTKLDTLLEKIGRFTDIEK